MEAHKVLWWWRGVHTISTRQKSSIVSRPMEIIYLAKEDNREAYLNIYVIEGEAWSALLRWNQDASWIKIRAMLWLWGAEAAQC